MFTGIITDLGRVRTVERASARADARFVLGTAYDPDGIAIGASICCSGACLTVVDKGVDGGDAWFAADVSAETLERTTLGGWQAGTPVNLERSLRAGDEMGGHIVTGHVDGRATLVERRAEGGSVRLTFAAPGALARYVAPKGSVALDGVSLTVNDVADGADGTARFGINVIPHTQNITSLGALGEGGAVNLEVDVLARYVARQLGEEAP